ncbi:MAG TPA: hypothetical protein DGT23_30115 [Micromonosporaceae bacterium]|nr:hypothetical protein [Micromonosporaceae bacterium]
MADGTERLKVRDWLFLIAHKSNGTPRVHDANLAAGLAGAVLIDLALQELVTTDSRDMLGLRGSPPTGDPIGDYVLSRLSLAPLARFLPDVIRWLGGDITSRVGAGLHTANFVSMTASKKMFSAAKLTYRPTSKQPAQYVVAAITAAVNGSQYTGPRELAICGLVGVMRLESLLGMQVPTLDLLQRLDYLLQTCPKTVVNIVAAVEHLIGEQAMATHN